MTDEPMNEDQIWETARSFHERMAEEIRNPGDMLGVSAVIITNMLVAGVMAGLDPSLVGSLLDSIKQDVDNALKTLTVSDQDNTSVQ